jgi:hypothetical protein
MKEGNLFCFVIMRSTEWGPVLGVFGKLSMRRGAWALVPWRFGLGYKSS